jgi:hypothetical protein
MLPLELAFEHRNHLPSLGRSAGPRRGIHRAGSCRDAGR